MDTFPAPLTIKLASQIKDAFAHFRSEVRSAHLTEAVARGLGFNTHAALLARLKTAPSVASDSTPFDYDACSTRLVEFGYPAVSATHTSAIALNVIQHAAVRPQNSDPEGAANEAVDRLYRSASGQAYSIEEPPEYRILDETAELFRLLETGHAASRTSVTQANIALFAQHLGEAEQGLERRGPRKEGNINPDVRPNRIIRALLPKHGDVGSMPVGSIDMTTRQQHDALLFVTRNDSDSDSHPVTVVRHKARPLGGPFSVVFDIQEARARFLDTPSSTHDGEEEGSSAEHPRPRGD